MVRPLEKQMVVKVEYVTEVVDLLNTVVKEIGPADEHIEVCFLDCCVILQYYRVSK